MSKAMFLIVAERQRQVSVERYLPELDDSYVRGELMTAALCYQAVSRKAVFETPANWPWPTHTFKPKGRIEDLTRAGALALAEVERLARAADQVDDDADWGVRIASVAWAYTAGQHLAAIEAELAEIVG